MSDEAKTPNSSDNQYETTAATRRNQIPGSRSSCPAACASCPDSCSFCNPPIPRQRCRYCHQIGAPGEAPHSTDCPELAEDRLDGEDVRPPETIPNPRAAQLLIDLLDGVIGLHPLDERYVVRIADNTVVRITNINVLKLLGTPVDQRTTTAITTQLAKIAEHHVGQSARQFENNERQFWMHQLRAKYIAPVVTA